MRDRPGWYTVVVYDRVAVAGEKPAKVTRRVEGLRNARNVEREVGGVLEEADTGHLREEGNGVLQLVRQCA